MMLLIRVVWIYIYIEVIVMVLLATHSTCCLLCDPRTAHFKNPVKLEAPIAWTVENHKEGF